MAYKIIDATSVRSGSAIIIDGEPCIVKSIDISKTGKHGHAKARIEATGIIDGKKRVIARPGHERFEVPLINKRKAQVLSIKNNDINVMDIESYENFDLTLDSEIEEGINEGDEIEYWEIDGKKIIKRRL
ncbi:MAG: translation initiation factor IF-5A [Candidatus Pacearchaeota archaeon]